MKYLRVASDLHFEFRRDKGLNHILPPDDRDDESVLILAGDICANTTILKKVLAQAWYRFPKIVFVPGNHEFYGADLADWGNFRENLYMEMGTNCTIPNQFPISEKSLPWEIGEIVELIDGFHFLATTLWTTCGKTPLDRLRIRGGMNDFLAIRNNGLAFTPENMEELSRKQAKTLENRLVQLVGNDHPAPTVVVTHHLPSYQLCDPRHMGNGLDGGFASDYDHLLMKPFAPMLWIHGHTHHYIACELGDTKILCNPLGYPGEETGFKPKLFVDLKALQEGKDLIECLLT